MAKHIIYCLRCMFNESQVTFDAKEVGKMWKIRLEHNVHKAEAGWNLEKVTTRHAYCDLHNTQQ